MLNPGACSQYAVVHSGSHSAVRTCRLGRRVLRPLLRSEIGDVSNRRAWHNPSKVTDAVRELYKAPLRVQNWDHALIEVRSSCTCHVDQSLFSCRQLSVVAQVGMMMGSVINR